MTVFYAHLREMNNDGTIAGNGGVTVAYEVHQLDGFSKVLYAMAKCHAKDRYNKHLGRVKAEGRMKSPSYSQTFEGTKREFLDHMYSIWYKNDQ
jgi:RecA-family ATPase